MRMRVRVCVFVCWLAESFAPKCRKIVFGVFCVCVCVCGSVTCLCIGLCGVRV